MADLNARSVGEKPLRDPVTAPAAANEPQPSLAQLFNSLIADAQLLIRREIDLARTELRQEVSKTRQAATLLGAGLVLALIGLNFLIAMFAELLVVFGGLAYWLAYLIVGGGVALIGGIIIYLGIQRFQEVNPVPEETIDSVRKDVSWLKEQSPSDKT
jgi:hypothetical protein